jgi:uncharacterized membrane protein YcaP (DUF421 family)
MLGMQRSSVTLVARNYRRGRIHVLDVEGLDSGQLLRMILTFSSKRLERAIEGTPKILIRHGHRRAAELQRQRITKAELLEALRNHGCANITDVRVAILENDGTITVIKR